MKKGVLLINLGTPDSFSVSDVRKYLREFLMDARVMDMPYLKRWFLINLIIAPFRAPQSAKIYKELWKPEGSPLKIYGEELRAILQSALGGDFIVGLGMRYQNPSVASVLKRFEGANLSELIVVPLYPQYASASTGSTIEAVTEIIKKWDIIPDIRVISKFFDHPLFIKAFVERANHYLSQHHYDHFVFSYHGLPESHIKKASYQNYCQLNSKCCSVYHQRNLYCYRAQCFETSRLLAAELNIPADKMTVCFQSRLGKTPWIHPYTDEIIPSLVKGGIKNVLVFSPAFIADCLETTIEVGVEYKKIFTQLGGGRWDLVESLNTHPWWVECLKQLVLQVPGTYTYRCQAPVGDRSSDLGMIQNS